MPDPKRQLLAAAVLVALVGFGVWRLIAQPAAGGKAVGQPRGAGALQITEPAGDAGLVVDVAGAVRRPGVYTMPEGSRAADALVRAGGLSEGAVAEAINRAAPLVDGQQILVPQQPISGGGAAPAEPGVGPQALVSINSADEQALADLDGIGPATAAAIVRDRSTNGPFASVDELDRVAGIGPATVEQLREQVTL